MLSGKKILIIDDERDHCTILKSYFQTRRAEVFTGFTIRDLWVQLEKKPDILLLDNNLPDGKAWNIVDEVVKKFPHLKIYLISAYFQKDDPVPPFENVTAWPKPLSLALLKETFDNFRSE